MPNLLAAAAADLETANAEFQAAESAYADAANRRALALKRVVETQREVSRLMDAIRAKAPSGTPWAPETHDGSTIRSILRDAGQGQQAMRQQRVGVGQ